LLGSKGCKMNKLQPDSNPFNFRALLNQLSEQ